MADQYQRSITSGRSLSDTEDEDAITPAPITTSAIDPIPCQPCCSRESSSAEPTPRSLQREGRRPHSGGSWRKRVRRSDLTEDEDVDTERLWRRMLDIQRMFGCYNSARMSAALALSGGDEDEVSRLRRKSISSRLSRFALGLTVG